MLNRAAQESHDKTVLYEAIQALNLPEDEAPYMPEGRAYLLREVFAADFARLTRDDELRAIRDAVARILENA